jgi:ABC-type uncharacterized transport system auxiliary subunit
LTSVAFSSRPRAPRSPTVELSTKILGEDGKIVDAKTFRTSAPAKDTDAPAAALNEAFRTTAAELIAWAVAMIQ